MWYFITLKHFYIEYYEEFAANMEFYGIYNQFGTTFENTFVFFFYIFCKRETMHVGTLTFFFDIFQFPGGKYDPDPPDKGIPTGGCN